MSSFHGRATVRHNPAWNALRAIVFIVALVALVAIPAHQAQATGVNQRSLTVGTVTKGTATRVATVDLATAAASRVAVSGDSENRALPYRRPYTRPAGIQAPTVAMVPHVQSSIGASTPVSGTAINNFPGLDSLNSYKVNSFHEEPPDQGLCVGPGGPYGTSSVLETVNSVSALYTPAGNLLLGPISNDAFFGENSAGFGLGVESTSDPRCYYDPTAHAWFATVIAYDAAGTESHVDLAVNTHDSPRGPWVIYHINTLGKGDVNCPCLGDQPLLGVDDHGVYISTNEFPLHGPGFNGAQIYAVSKKDLLAHAASPFVAHFGNLTIPGGFAASSLQPAQNPHGSSVEYFVNALDPTQTIDNRVGVSAMTNDAVLDTGGTPTFITTIISSELYGSPPNAPQAGSAQLLSTGDDRMQQVQYLNGVLYSALTSVVLINGDVESRAGIAWFKIIPFVSGSTIAASILDQGYTSFFGHYLMYPAIAVNDANQGVMALSASGSDIFPTAGYATGSTFQSLSPSAVGVQSDHGFTCTDPRSGFSCRWGDYHAAARDNLTGNIWVASEWIGGPGDALTNWSTQVSEVAP